MSWRCRTIENMFHILFYICLQTRFPVRLMGHHPEDSVSLSFAVARPMTPTPRKNTQRAVPERKLLYQKPSQLLRGSQHSQSIPKTKPVHIAALYAFSCAPIGALSPCWSTEMPTRCDLALKTLLNTIVDTLKPIADPSCVIAWNSAPATLCSCGSDISEMNNVPDANMRSTPSTIRQAEGKPKAQYGALGSMTAKKMQPHPVMNVPVAIRRRKEET